MNRIGVLLAILVGTGLFIYGVSYFLVATFDISEWQNGQRFITLLVYWIAVRPVRHALIEPESYPAFRNRSAKSKVETIEPIRQQLQEA